jgi:hypothetical protein
MDTPPAAIIHHVSRQALAASLAAAALLLPVLPAAAHAGTYTVTACNDAPGGANNSWTAFNTDTTHLQTRISCPYTINEGQLANQENGIATTDILELPNGAQTGAQAGWKFKVPDPESEKITSISYDRMLSTQDQYWIPALRANGAILPGQTCTPPIAGSCLTGSGPGGNNHATLTGLSAETLTLGLECVAPTGQECITGASGFHAAVATMYAAEVTIEDDASPTLEPPTGPLWENAGYHKGTENLTLAARDASGGVQNLTMSLDRQPVENYTAPCNYTYPRPCPLQAKPTLTLDTTKFPDGIHNLTLVATDAAGNQSTPTTRQITIANNPPLPPVNLTATPTYTGSPTFDVTWTNPADPTPISEATYQLCSASGPCATPTAAPPNGPATVTAPGPGTWTITVWLHDAAGNSNPADSAHATFTVSLEESGGGPGGRRNSSGGGPGSSGSGGGSSTVPKAKLQITESLHGRKLTVRVTGPPTGGQVYVRYTGRFHGKLIAAAAKKVMLRHGKLTVTFILPKVAAAHATIRVTALLDHSPAAASTLHRRHKSP